MWIDVMSSINVPFLLPDSNAGAAQADDVPISSKVPKKVR